MSEIDTVVAHALGLSPGEITVRPVAPGLGSGYNTAMSDLSAAVSYALRRLPADIRLRPLDPLEWRIADANLEVRWVRFQTGIAERVPVGGS